MPRRGKSILAGLPQPEIVEAADVLRAYEAGEYDLICVLGPTASGKTRYAVRLAEEMDAVRMSRMLCCPGTMAASDGEPRGAEIISADSRQIYRGMDIGTGKDLCEYGDIPYHLIDIQPAGAKYNVYEYVKDFNRAYSSIRAKGGVPILCGGTGLYINAVTAGYDFASKQPLSESRESAMKVFFIGTLVSREVRNSRIDARLDARLEEGMVDEIKSLLDGTNPGCGGVPVPPETLIAYGLEYKFVTQYVLGTLSYDEMRLKLSTAIHQFAKRQMTWFRGMERSGAVVHWVEV